MFADQHEYVSRDDSASYGDSGCNSASSSFSATSWQDVSDASFGQQSTTLLKLEDMAFSSFLPDNESIGGLMPDMTQEMAPELANNDIMFNMDGDKMMMDQPMMVYNHFATFSAPTYQQFDVIENLSTEPPALTLDLYSPISLGSPPVFVTPSQTTFDDPFISSPMPPTKNNFHQNTPSSDYGSDSILNSPARDFSCSSSHASIMCQDGYRSSSSSPFKLSQLRQPMFDPLKTSAALHQVQSDDNIGNHSRRGYHEPLKVKRERSSMPVPAHIKIESKAHKACPYSGCSSKFQRQEHLKRHEKTHNQLPSDQLQCPFCPKKFGRSDNLKSHIDLHTKKAKKSSRTEYFPDAARVYAEMSRKPRKSENLISGAFKKEEDYPTKIFALRSRM